MSIDTVHSWQVWNYHVGGWEWRDRSQVADLLSSLGPGTTSCSTLGMSRWWPALWLPWVARHRRLAGGPVGCFWSGSWCTDAVGIGSVVGSPAGASAKGQLLCHCSLGRGGSRRSQTVEDWSPRSSLPWWRRFRAGLGLTVLLGERDWRPVWWFSLGFEGPWALDLAHGSPRMVQFSQ